MSKDEIDKIVELCDRLLVILVENKGQSHLPGVRSIMNSLSDEKFDIRERIEKSRSIFKTMMGGAGTLGDFVIWDNNEDRRLLLNQELDSVLSGIWELLGC